MLYYLYESGLDEDVTRTEYDYLPYALSIYDAYANSGCIRRSTDPGVQHNKEIEDYTA